MFRHLVDENQNSIVCVWLDLSSVISPQNWLPWQRPSKDQKLTSPDRSYTANPANFVEFGPIDVEIIGLTEVVKNKYKINKYKKQRQNINPPSAAGPLAKNYILLSSCLKTNINILR